MKIDAHTGQVELSEFGLVISPALTRGEFLASPTGQTATARVQNGAFASWNFGTATVEGTEITFTIYFRDEILEMLSLGFFRNEWENGAEDPALLEKREAERLLKQVWNAPPKNYRWGSISTSIDPRSGYASTSVIYKSPPWKKALNALGWL